MRTTIISLASLLACSSSPSPTPDRQPTPKLGDGASAVVDAVADSLAILPDLRWLVGDFHMHVSPPDDPSDVRLSVDEIAVAARDAKLDFVVLTPHVWPKRWGPQFRREWKQMAERAHANTSLTLIPGVEWTTGSGHFGVTGVDLSTIEAPDLLAAAHAAGGFVSVNHPFAVPTNIPGVRASHFDMSYRVWTDNKPGFTAIDGVEVWNMPLSMANLISKPGGRTGEARAWSAADRVVHDEHRRITAVGGTDNHQLNVMATTWVLAAGTTEAAILDALRAGATCVGGVEAGSMRAHGDADKTWVRVGGSVKAARTMTLAWDGRARLYVDDVDRGELDGGFVDQTNGALHTYRIEVGASRCGFIYANL
jgi:predicted metal-dependent phosphoesterase TrpH